MLDKPLFRGNWGICVQHGSEQLPYDKPQIISYPVMFPVSGKDRVRTQASITCANNTTTTARLVSSGSWRVYIYMLLLPSLMEKNLADCVFTNQRANFD